MARLLLLLSLAAQDGSAQAPTQDRGPAHSLVLHDEGYLGSQACQECHAANHASWHASFHRTMTQAPSAAAVLAPFEGSTPVFEDVAWRLFHAEETNAYYATPIAADGTDLGPAARLALTTGSHHYQIYWFVSPATDGLQQLPLVWHRAEARWVPRRSMFLSPPGQTGSETDRWQEVCIKCHATNGTPRHEEFGATRAAELGISCEACHGPSADHAEWRRAHPEESAEESETRPVVPDELSAERSAQVCAQCHGIHLFEDPAAREKWEREGFAFRPGDDLAATHTLLRGRPERNTAALRAFIERDPGLLDEYFWPDGEVRVSGREYNGLVESPCFQRGVGERRPSCLSCHAMHASDARMREGWASDQLLGQGGSAACRTCHAELSQGEALSAHTHHGSDSSGSDCLNCHMPYTTYGLTKAIRSHTISSPKAAVSLATGRPSACNQCHLDRSLGWTAEHLAEWYGAERPQLDEDRNGIAESVLWSLRGDAGLRALAAWSLGWEPARAVSGTGWMPHLLSTLLQDEYDAVRWIAMRSARLLPKREEFALDFCAELEEQRNHVRETILADWLDDGLEANPLQAAAVLVKPDGTLDEATFRRLYSQRDNRAVRLGE